MEKPTFKPPNIGDVKLFKAVPPPFRRGPFQTKSGGQLFVDLVLPSADAEISRRFAAYRPEEEARLPRSIRGLRQYRVVDLPAGRVGGTEFHRIREEVVVGLAGQIRWTCEDLSGNKLSCDLTPDVGVWMPPFILHTYQTLEDRSGILVLCNTIFYPDDPATHDTYSTEEFRALQAAYR